MSRTGQSTETGRESVVSVGERGETEAGTACGCRVLRGGGDVLKSVVVGRIGFPITWVPRSQSQGSLATQGSTQQDPGSAERKAGRPTQPSGLPDVGANACLGGPGGGLILFPSRQPRRVH